MTEAGALDFEPWYRREHPRLVTLLVVLTGDVELGREAVDEAFARALEHWSSVSQMSSATGWVYRVALNVARRRARRSAVERRLFRRSRSESVPGPTGELWLLVAKLPERQRIAVLLRHVGQCTEQETADLMGVARGTVSSTLRSAYRHLGVALAADDPLLGEVDHGRH